MEPPELTEDGANGNTEMESWHQLPAEDDPSQFLEHTSAMHETTGQHGFTLSSEEQLSIIGEARTQRIANRFESLQLEFQDSHLSPALTLIPQGNTLIHFESTLLHQTDSEFAPLRGSPDFSIASGRCLHMSHLDMESVFPNTAHEQASLSQHPLGVTTEISEGGSSCCSLSQHSLSPTSHFQVTQVHEEEQGIGLKNKSERQMNAEENAVCALSGEAPFHSLHLGKDDVININTAFSSASEIAQSQHEAGIIQPLNQSKHTDFAHCTDSDSDTVKEPKSSQSESSREQPQGGSSSPSFQKKAAESYVSLASNITVRSSGVQPDPPTDLSDILQVSNRQSESTISEYTSQNRNRVIPSTLCVTPASGVGVHVPGLQRVIWGSCSQTMSDGSFLTSKPVSQSTPAMILSRAGAGVINKLSPISSHPDSVATMAILTQDSCSKTNKMQALELGTSDQTAPDVSCVTSSDQVKSYKSHIHTIPEFSNNHEASSAGLYVSALATEGRPLPLHSDALPAPFNKDQDSALCAGKVQSLPMLSYLQKVDAWKANQSSSRFFYENIGLQGFDSVPPKRNMQDSVCEGQSHMLAKQSPQHNRTMLDFATNTSVPASQSNIAISTGSVADMPRQGDLVGAGGAGAPASPLAHSHSHSSLSTVVTSIHHDGGQHNTQLPLAGSKSEHNLADQMETDTVKHSELLSLGQFCDVSSNPNKASALSSSQGSCPGEQSLLASVGASSSVVSLEVDNYAPYWTSRPESPSCSFELNIEDRIPMYLRNLGIDQSPSAILNPFTLRGPIREPEFSPTDLCTIKGSVGTPSKSAQLSEGESAQKDTFSSSSLFSVDSSTSLTRRLAVQKPDRPASQGSVRMMRGQVETARDPHTSQVCSAPQESSSPHQEGSYGIQDQLGSHSVPPPEAWSQAKEGESSLVGSGTLQEIRRLLGRAESLVSGHSSLGSSAGSHCYSESDASFLSLRRNTQAYLDDSSLSVGSKISLGLARTSSDSVLKESSSASCGPLQISSQVDHITAEATSQFHSGEENLKSCDLLVAPRRTEPEGCSAADPDKVGPVGLSVRQGNVSLSSNEQQSQESSMNTVVFSHENSHTHSPAEAELGALSDNSSESSLAARVAKLLQSESPVSVVTSRPSTTDPEESRAREWIMMKVSGHQCDALELREEDRKRIEEIKKELLLHTKQSKWSSDSEGSSQSSVGAAPKPTGGFAAVRSAQDRLSEQLQRATQNPLNPSSPLHTPFLDNLQAKANQVALREGLGSTAPLASITIATTRRTPSPHPLTHCQPAQEDPSLSAPQLECSCSPTHTSLKLTVEEIFISDKEIEEKGTTREVSNGIGTDVQENDKKKSDKTEWAVVQDASCKSSDDKNDTLPNVDSSLAPPLKSHMSHIHLTLSPKPQQSMTQRLHSHASDVCTPSEVQPGLQKRYFDRQPNQSILRGVPPVSIPSEEKHASKISETSASKVRQADQCTGLVSDHSQMSSRYQKVFTPAQRLPGSARPLSVDTAAIPTLLPYKPHGSAELFYMPQNDLEISPSHSNTTMESSHTESDDALPPHFTSEILGSREVEDKNIIPKHKEGIYSKRAKMNRESLRVFERSCLDSKVASCTHRSNLGSHDHLPASSRSNGPDKGKGILHKPVQAEGEEKEFVSLRMEADYRIDDFHQQSHTVRKRGLLPETLPLPIKPIREEEQSMKTQELGLVISNSLDQLWHRFSQRYSLQENQPTNEGETSLLERLERLSRLLHSSTPPHTPAKEACSRDEKGKIRRRELELRRVQEKESSRRGKNMDRSQVTAVPKTAWEEDSLRTDKTLEEAQGNFNRCPAEKDESASVSVETSSSQSTIDTQHLLRAFVPHSVKGGSAGVTGNRTQKTSGSLLKLYNNINKQKRGDGNSIRDQIESEIISTDESMASGDSLSSSSTYTLPSQKAVGRTLTTKRPKVKLVSRSIQAGDLEIVVNGTRRHTRDVGTTFPSPGNTRDNRDPSSATTERQASIPTSRYSSTRPALSQTGLRRDGLHKFSQTCYPNGVSWFVSADELKPDARKENEPQPEILQAESQAWFEPYTRSKPWREPLREPLRERHIQLEQKKPLERKAPVETQNSKPAALVHLSLQEALELRRPEFMSRSRERMKRLCLLAEERKMQAIFNREREELFNRPLPLKQPTAAPPPMPTKRVIPVKEMVQRSKRIYAKLPEVQKRKQEEKRKAEYRGYRLNAQLFNKKVTNRVLGRKTPWQ